MNSEITEALNLLGGSTNGVADLYEKWWSGIRMERFCTRRPIVMHQPVFVRNLFARERFEVFSDGIRAVIAKPGEYILHSEELSKILRRRTWSNDFWNWGQSAALESYPVDQENLRFYIPSHEKDRSEIAQEIEASLDSQHIPYVLKYRLHDGVFKDAIVLYAKAKSVMPILETIAKVCHSSSFISSPPPLALPVSGFGVSEHPATGESLGWLFSETLWTYSKGSSGLSVDEYFKSKNLNPDFPWRLEFGATQKKWEGVCLDFFA
jgi:hypothetical protein